MPSTTSSLSSLTQETTSRSLRFSLSLSPLFLSLYWMKPSHHNHILSLSLSLSSWLTNYCGKHFERESASSPRSLMPRLMANPYISLSALCSLSALLFSYQEDLKVLVGQKLPLPNRTLLQYLIHFFCRLSFCSEVNKTTPSTLALVFGPELIRPKQVRCFLLFKKTHTSSGLSSNIVWNGGGVGVTFVCTEGYLGEPLDVWQDSKDSANTHRPLHRNIFLTCWL